MKNILAALSLLSVLFITGCTGLNESLYPSDITVAELQKRKDDAADPEKRFAGASTYIMRQQVSDSNWLSASSAKVIEQKYKSPDKIKCVISENGEPISGYIINGASAWNIDYKSKKVVPIQPQNMAMIKNLTKLNTPATSYADVFQNVDIFRCKTSEGEFYKLVCSNNTNNTFEIYINASTYLIAKMRTTIKLPNGTIKTDSIMKNYTLYEGIRLPDESVSITGDDEQIQKVVYYKLDIPLDDSEFIPPVL